MSTGSQDKFRILHITEVFDSGVREFIRSLVTAQLKEGADVSLAFSQCESKMSQQEIVSSFPRATNFQTIPSGRYRFGSALRIWRFLKSAVNQQAFDVIHIHSSYAGFAGRLLPKKYLLKTKFFYSPHGFSTLKTDSNIFSRSIFYFFERVLAKRKCRFMLTSPSEADYALKFLKPRYSIDILSNGIDRSYIRSHPRAAWKTRPRVAMIGRICYQKAPWRFQRIATQLQELADFVWFGFRDGDEPSQLGLNSALVELQPWMGTDALIEALESVDLLIFPTLWEGFSLSVPLAQARGIPCLVSKVVGNIDSVLDGQSGFICQSEEEMLSKLREIFDSPEKYENLSKNALAFAKSKLTNDFIGKHSLAVYTRVDDYNDYN